MQRDVQTTAARLNRTVVETPLGRDENGFLDRSCPSCSTLFKIAGENPSESVKACPSCGHNDPNGRWETPAQQRRSLENAREHAASAVKAAFSGTRSAVPGFSRPYAGTLAFSGLEPSFSGLRSAGTGMINFRQTGSSDLGVNVMREGKWVVVGVPAAAIGVLRTERSCRDCRCRCSFIGSAFFCPGCGVASAEENFLQSIAAVRGSIDQCRSLWDKLPADDAANIERALFEKAMADLVTGFQLVAETLYQRLSAMSAPMNAFQRLDGGTSGEALWSALTGRHYADYIGSEGRAKLRRYFQRRHVLAHKDGFVDQSYLDRSGDTDYRPGQRLVVRGWEVEEFAQLIEALIVAMQGTAGTSGR